MRAYFLNSKIFCFIVVTTYEEGNERKWSAVNCGRHKQNISKAPSLPLKTISVGKHFHQQRFFQQVVTNYNTTKLINMMTSSNGNIFRVTGPLCGEFTGPGEFLTQRPVSRSFDVFFDLRLNKRLSKQPWGWWFQTPSWSLWRQCNVVQIIPEVDHAYVWGFDWSKSITTRMKGYGKASWIVYTY